MSEIFIDTLEAARRLGYLKDDTPPSIRRARNAFRMFARRHNLTLIGRRRLRVSAIDIDLEMHRQEQIARRRPRVA
jgi:hypothetical protein